MNEYTEEKPRRLVVYPEILPLRRLGLTSHSPFGTVRSRQPLFEDPARQAGLRNYQPGDSMRRIHWKASAHEGELLVKKFEPAISLDTALLLDLAEETYSPQHRVAASEWAIVVAASLAAHLTRERQAVGLLTNGTDPLAEKRDAPGLLPRPGAGQLTQVLEVLARIELRRDARNFAGWLRPATADLSWGTTVIALAPTGDESLCWALHGLVRVGFNVTLIVVEPHGDFRPIRQRSRRLGFTAHLVAYERDLAPWQRQAAGTQVYSNGYG